MKYRLIDAEKTHHGVSLELWVSGTEVLGSHGSRVWLMVCCRVSGQKGVAARFLGVLWPLIEICGSSLAKDLTAE